MARGSKLKSAEDVQGQGAKNLLFKYQVRLILSRLPAKLCSSTPTPHGTPTIPISLHPSSRTLGPPGICTRTGP
jgi:hypothetical protein